MSLSDKNLSLKSHLGLHTDLEVAFKTSLDLLLFHTLDSFFKEHDIIQMQGNLSRVDIERYTRHNFRSIINALTFDDKQFLLEAYKFVYRVYMYRGADIDFMLSLYDTASKSSKKLLASAYSKEAIKIFAFLADMHLDFIAQGKIPKVAIKQENHFFDEQQKLYQLILDTKIAEAEKFSYQFIEEHSLHVFITKLMRIVMMQVGYDWEINKITYAKEHLVTAIFENILQKFLEDKSPKMTQKNLIMVVTTPHESHSSGADTFTKFLKSQGYNAYLVKEQKSIDAIVSQVSLARPKILAISVTLPTNLYEVADIIYEINSKLIGLDLKVIVGGQALDYFYELAYNLGADAYVNDLQEACKIIDQFIIGKNNE